MESISEQNSINSEDYSIFPPGLTLAEIGRDTNIPIGQRAQLHIFQKIENEDNLRSQLEAEETIGMKDNPTVTWVSNQLFPEGRTIDDQMEWEEERQRKLESKRQELVVKEKQSMSAPKINRRSSIIIENSLSKNYNSSSLSSSSSSSPTKRYETIEHKKPAYLQFSKPVGDRLYDAACETRQNLNNLRKKALYEDNLRASSKKLSVKVQKEGDLNSREASTHEKLYQEAVELNLKKQEAIKNAQNKPDKDEDGNELFKPQMAKNSFSQKFGAHHRNGRKVEEFLYDKGLEYRRKAAHRQHMADMEAAAKANSSHINATSEKILNDKLNGSSSHNGNKFIDKDNTNSNSSPSSNSVNTNNTTNRKYQLESATKLSKQKIRHFKDSNLAMEAEENEEALLQRERLLKGGNLTHTGPKSNSSGGYNKHDSTSNGNHNNFHNGSILAFEDGEQEQVPPVFLRNLKWEEDRQKKLEYARMNKGDDEMNDCTFQPVSHTREGEGKVEKYRRQGQKEKEWLEKKRQENRKTATRPLPSAEAFSARLKQKQDRTFTLVEQKRNELQGSELKECTFTPIKSTSIKSILQKTGTPKDKEDAIHEDYTHNNNGIITTDTTTTTHDNSSVEDFHYAHSSTSPKQRYSNIKSNHTADSRQYEKEKGMISQESSHCVAPRMGEPSSRQHLRGNTIRLPVNRTWAGSLRDTYEIDKQKEKVKEREQQRAKTRNITSPHSSTSPNYNYRITPDSSRNSYDISPSLSAPRRSKMNIYVPSPSSTATPSSLGNTATNIINGNHDNELNLASLQVDLNDGLMLSMSDLKLMKSPNINIKSSDTSPNTDLKQTGRRRAPPPPPPQLSFDTPTSLSDLAVTLSSVVPITATTTTTTTTTKSAPTEKDTTITRAIENNALATEASTTIPFPTGDDTTESPTIAAVGRGRVPVPIPTENDGIVHNEVANTSNSSGGGRSKYNLKSLSRRVSLLIQTTTNADENNNTRNIYNNNSMIEERREDEESMLDDHGVEIDMESDNNINANNEYSHRRSYRYGYTSTEGEGHRGFHLQSHVHEGHSSSDNINMSNIFDNVEDDEDVGDTDQCDRNSQPLNFLEKFQQKPGYNNGVSLSLTNLLSNNNASSSDSNHPHAYQTYSGIHGLAEEVIPNANPNPNSITSYENQETKEEAEINISTNNESIEAPFLSPDSRTAQFQDLRQFYQQKLDWLSQTTTGSPPP